MEITRVIQKTEFVPLAISIDENTSIEFINELCMNTYPGNGCAYKREEGAIGAGIIDVEYGSGDHDYESIMPGQTGWLVLDEHTVNFYVGDSIWNEYDKA